MRLSMTLAKRQGAGRAQAPARDQKRRRGLTLIEVLLAAVVALLVIVVGANTLDDAWMRMYEELRRRSGLVSEEGRVALALLHLGKRMEVADRAALAAPLFQFREPAGCTLATAPGCFDNGGTYVWHQYQLSGTDLQYNRSPGCGAWATLASQVTAFSLQYMDESAPPPGGDPPFAGPPNDSNVLRYLITWDDGAGRNRIFQGEVAMRAAAYTDIATGPQEPLLPDQSPPPPGC